MPSKAQRSSISQTCSSMSRTESSCSACAGDTGFEDRAPGALTTVLGEIPEQRVHVIERSAVDDVSARALLRNQSCIRQLLEMKRQRAAGDVGSLGYGSRRQSGLTPKYQGPKYPQPDRLGQSRKAPPPTRFQTP